jgi:dTMP kinase
MARLSKLGLKCYGTKEPTDSPIGSLIRQILTGRIKADRRVLANLFAADRADHLLNDTDGICHKINNGISVVTDRYYFSSYAFNGGNDIDMDWLININAVSFGILRPDITVFLDVTAERAMQRINSSRFHLEFFEQEDRLRLVREKYFEAFAKLKGVENVAVIDADADEETVAGRIWEKLSGYFIF